MNNFHILKKKIVDYTASKFCTLHYKLIPICPIENGCDGQDINDFERKKLIYENFKLVRL